MSETTSKPVPPTHPEVAASAADASQAASMPMQRPFPDPTRYGDWEKNGRCIDF